MSGRVVAGANLVCYPGVNLGFDAQDLKIEPGTPNAGVQIAEVAVDTETGEVRVEKVTAIADAGKIINPKLAAVVVDKAPRLRPKGQATPQDVPTQRPESDTPVEDVEINAPIQPTPDIQDTQLQ